VPDEGQGGPQPLRARLGAGGTIDENVYVIAHS
jgi:hypothetical protein